jgi:hypothetical protein
LGCSASTARSLREGGIVFVVILTALMLRVELHSHRPSLPRAAYVLGVSGMVFLAFVTRDPFLFIVLWIVQHWSAAMGLTLLVASGGAQEPVSRWQRLLAPINRRGCAALPSCLRFLHWASRAASSTTCWIAPPSASHPQT